MNEHLSQELSKRLHELGVVVESASDWTKYGGDWQVLPSKDFVKMEKFPAPTFIELWAMLPETILMNKMTYDLCLAKNCAKTMAGYFCPMPGCEDNVKEYSHESPTEAAGMLLIWLAENGHLKGE